MSLSPASHRKGQGKLGETKASERIKGSEDKRKYGKFLTSEHSIS